MAKHQDTLEDWERTGGPAVDRVIDAARGLSKRTGMTFRESVETIIETVYQRLGWKSDRDDDPEKNRGSEKMMIKIRCPLCCGTRGLWGADKLLNPVLFPCRACGGNGWVEVSGRGEEKGAGR